MNSKLDPKQKEKIMERKVHGFETMTVTFPIVSQYGGDAPPCPICKEPLGTFGTHIFNAFDAQMVTICSKCNERLFEGAPSASKET